MLNLGLGFGACGSGLEHEHSDRLRKVQLRRSALHMQIYVETYLYTYSTGYRLRLLSAGTACQKPSEKAKPVPTALCQSQLVFASCHRTMLKSVRPLEANNGCGSDDCVNCGNECHQGMRTMNEHGRSDCR